MTEINDVSAYARLKRACDESGSLLCCGLDIPWEKVPEWYKKQCNVLPTETEFPVLMLTDLRTAMARVECHASYIEKIVTAVAPGVCAYKPNLAFFGGVAGSLVLFRVVRAIHQLYPSKLVIGDGKWGDIDNTQQQNAANCFNEFGFDGATVNPYMGYDAIKPFASRGDKLAFVLALTSNPGSKDLQYVRSRSQHHLYSTVVRKVTGWNKDHNLGIVVGATHPKELKGIRQRVGKMPILIPGIGAQQGDLEASVCYGVDEDGENAIINIARAIIFASLGEDFAEAAGVKAVWYSDEINKFRQEGA